MHVVAKAILRMALRARWTCSRFHTTTGLMMRFEHSLHGNLSAAVRQDHARWTEASTTKTIQRILDTTVTDQVYGTAFSRLGHPRLHKRLCMATFCGRGLIVSVASDLSCRRGGA